MGFKPSVKILSGLVLVSLVGITMSARRGPLPIAEASEVVSEERILKIDQKGDIVYVEIRNADVRDVAKRLTEVLGTKVVVEDDVSAVVKEYGPDTLSKERLRQYLRHIVRPNWLRVTDTGEEIRISRIVMRRTEVSTKPKEPFRSYHLFVGLDGMLMLDIPASTDPGAFREGSREPFDPSALEDLADRLDELFEPEKRWAKLQLSPSIDRAVLTSLQELMHDRNYAMVYSIGERIKPTEEGPEVVAWEFHKNKDRIQVFRKEIVEVPAAALPESVMRRRGEGRGPIMRGEFHLTNLGGHVKRGEVRGSGTEDSEVTLFLDEEGVALLQNLANEKPGIKLALSAEGVEIGETEVPAAGDVKSLTFPVPAERRKRLEHAFEMSKLKLTGTE